MTIYLTPDRYRAMGFGLDLTNVEDVELRAVLERASALVDAYCAIPNLPQKHDFRGGVITQEHHPWTLGTDWTPIGPGSRRVYFIHPPILTVEKFVVKFTNTYQVEIEPQNLYLNEIEGWGEVVSLSAVVSGLYPVGINYGLYTPVAEVDYTYGYTYTSAEETLYPTDALTYQANNGFWKTSPAPVVKKNGTTLTPTSDYTVQSDEGQVKLATPLAPSDTLTATYSYKLASQIAQATGMTATHLLGQRALAAKGLTGITAIQIAELRIDRRIGRAGAGSAVDLVDTVPPEAQRLLDPFAFRSIGIG